MARRSDFQLLSPSQLLQSLFRLLEEQSYRTVGQTRDGHQRLERVLVVTTGLVLRC